MSASRPKSTDEVNEIFGRLQDTGYWFWTAEISQALTEEGLDKKLKRTRSAFIDLLERSTPEGVVGDLTKPPSPLTPQLATTHAIIATNGGAEILDRTKAFIAYRGIKELHIREGGTVKAYPLKELGTKFTGKLSNEKIRGASNALREDILQILCFGSQIDEFKEFLSFSKFKLGRICGNQQAIKSHFEDLYLDVSRVLAGIASASSGTTPKNIVLENMSNWYGNGPSVSRIESSRIELGPDDNRQFDIAYRVNGRNGQTTYLGIEVAFQETTNSVIERKAKQARELFPLFIRKGYYLCYVVDGAGYFARTTALRDIIRNSHLCIGFRESEMARLRDFVEEIRRT